MTGCVTEKGKVSGMKVLLYKGGMKLVGKSGVGRAVSHQAEALEKAGIAYTFQPKEDYDIVHINTVFPDSLWMSMKARMRGKRVVYYGHSTREDFRNSFPGSNLAAGLFQWWICLCYGSGDVVITPTDYSKRLLQSYPVSVDMVALSNGVNLKEFQRTSEGRKRFRAFYNISDSQKVILGVGHYIERKGILDFAAMAKRFPQYEFWWFGYTPSILVTKQVKKVLHQKLPNLHFPGYVESAKLADAYSGSDLFFFPTQEETEGIVMLEAMAMRIPVLVRDIPVYEGWLEHGKNVYKGKNRETFAALLPEILEGKLPDLTQEAYRTVQENSIDRIGKRLTEIYDRLSVGENRLPAAE